WAEQGAIPAMTARKNCAEGGVDVITTNQDDEPFTFELAERDYTVKPGETRTVTVPVAEDRTYDFTVLGADGFEKRFTGMLDCR
ncbi:phospholipase domain-containing protein, partial [Streptomyces sp. CHB19.2]